MPLERDYPYGPEGAVIADYRRETLSVSGLCDLHAISRKTVYKWIERYLRHGAAGLEERSCKLQSSPNQTIVGAKSCQLILKAASRSSTCPPRSCGGRC